MSDSLTDINDPFDFDIKLKLLMLFTFRKFTKKKLLVADKVFFRVAKGWWWGGGKRT